MDNLISILHVLAAIVFLGPVTIAVSMFQGRARAAHEGDSAALGSAAMLHRITKTYGFLSLLVPLLGLGLFLTDTVFLKDGRFHVSILLSVVAWGILFFLIVPQQKKLMANLGVVTDDDDPASALNVDDGSIDGTAGVNWTATTKKLSMFGGIFSLLWFIVAILMMI
ncbi:DUF2269 domain-containing protein [Corynebacterium sp. CCM 9203]|uniref:DUF2269 domain-containing protein n=1 Tax=Corynebacterium sp. CCM 9203 TaxID=3057615 RepID=UPI003524CE71